MSLTRPPPGLLFPTQDITNHASAYSVQSDRHHIAPPPGLASPGGRCDHSSSEEGLDTGVTAETSTRRASTRTCARALLRAKARARRRTNSDQSSNCAESSASQPLRECSVGSLCVRSRAESFGSQALDECATATRESDNELSEEASPTSACSSAISQIALTSEFHSSEAELAYLRARFAESERERLRARDEVTALAQQLAQAQLFSKMHKDELERIVMQNRLLMNDWHQAVQERQALQHSFQLTFGTSPLFESQPSFPREALRRADDQSSLMFSPNLFGMQAMPILIH